MIEIRPASEADMPTVRDIAYQTWPVAYAGILTPYQLQYMLERFYSDKALSENLKQNHRFLIAWENGRPLGFASFVTDTPKTGTAKIPKIYVLPNTQGKGIGRKLVDAICEKARLAGNRTLTLNVNRFNKALDFYRHIGFEVVGEEDIDLGDGVVQEDYILEMALS